MDAYSVEVGSAAAIGRMNQWSARSKPTFSSGVHESFWFLRWFVLSKLKVLHAPPAHVSGVGTL